MNTGAQDRSYPGVTAASPSPTQSRLWRWQLLAHVALEGAQRRGPRLEIRYRPLPGVSAELALLVAAEARHCSLLTWTLEQRCHGTEEQLVVRIEASTEHPDDIAGIAFFVDAQIAAAQIAAAQVAAAQVDAAARDGRASPLPSVLFGLP
jgi:hypothetical protein